MRQYFQPVNQDKKEFVCPWCIGTDANLFEWADNRPSAIFTVLLRQSNKSGADWGGDYPKLVEICNPRKIGEVHTTTFIRGAMLMPVTKESIVGRWAGDRVALVGNLDESGLFATATELYRNISEPLVEALNAFLGIDKRFVLRYRRCSGCTERVTRKT